MLSKTGAPPVAHAEPGEEVMPVSDECHARCETFLNARLHGQPPLFPIVAPHVTGAILPFGHC